MPKDSDQSKHMGKSQKRDSDTSSNDADDSADTKDRGSQGPNNPRTAQNFVSRGSMGWVVLAGLGLLLLLLISNAQNQAKKITWQAFLQHAQERHFEKDSVTVEDERIVGTYGQIYRATNRSQATVPGSRPNQP